MKGIIAQQSAPSLFLPSMLLQSRGDKHWAHSAVIRTLARNPCDCLMPRNRPFSKQVMLKSEEIKCSEA